LLKENKLIEYHVEKGSILSPAAKDYLNQVKIRILFDLPGGEKRYYTDALTGEKYDEKPENMTHLTGNRLVQKDHPRIVLRGALDHLESQIVFAQVMLCYKYPGQLINDLEDVLAFVRNLLRAEVMDERPGDIRLLGMSSAELREQSHHPEKHFGVKAMTPPHYSMGVGLAHMNLLRSQARQVELAAVSAYRNGNKVSNQEMILALNRLSSGFHILCCRLLSGFYGDGGSVNE